MNASANSRELLALAAQIVAAQARNSDVKTNDLPDLIQKVYRIVSTIDANGDVPTPAQPAVPIKQSVTADYVVCLEDGLRAKMLKRHLAAAHGLTPKEYRRKWGLTVDHPITAPNFSKRRATIAKETSFGTYRRKGRKSGAKKRVSG